MQWAPTQASGHSAFDAPDEAGGSRWPPDPWKPSGDEPGSGTGGGSGKGSLSGPQWTSRDPRTSSSQSLVSSTNDKAGDDDRKRKLLVVYIHGFMGNNSSFRSFPAHVHSFLKNILAETHAIHTKIYPRYKTYKSIDVACDNFSRWLEPHESPTTDVVLVGHSMGGLLAADIVLLPNQQSTYNTSSTFRHRILGTISLDAPLLGLHPGIVVSGIASLFRPAPSPPQMIDNAQPDYLQAAQSDTLSPEPSIYSEVSPPPGAPSPSLQPYPSNSTLSSAAPGRPDPYFDAPFPNDVAFVDRGWFKNIVHFATKHKEENLVHAAAAHIVSHLEFGACLADYPELRSRYSRLRKLEDTVDWSQPGTVRVRFVNYYTVSTGIIKKPRSPSPGESSRQRDAPRPSERPSQETYSPAPAQSSAPKLSTEGSRVSTPRISIEEYKDKPRPESIESFQSLQVLDPIPEPEPEPESSQPPPYQPAASTANTEPTTGDKPLPDDLPINDLTIHDPENTPSTTTDLPTTIDLPSTTDLASPSDLPTIPDPDLPTIPPLPTPPPPPDLTAHPDKESRKLAEKSYKLALKAHAQALKDRNNTIKARDKALKDHQKALDKQHRQAAKLEKKQAKLLLKSPPPSPAGTNPHHNPENPQEKQKQQEKEKKKRLRKFCLLPSKSHSSGGGRDPAWVEVYMEGVDEVGAHCGLFLPGPHYERLVGDVGERIAGWVWEEASRRVVLEGGA